MSPENLKKSVAQEALNLVIPNLTPNSILGIGTGSTANHFIDGLADKTHLFKGAVSSSNASADRLAKLGIDVFDLNDIQNIEFYVDGADETTPYLKLIKGGGAALTQEKIVAAVAKTFICIADESKWVDVLGAFPLPVEVIPMALSQVSRAIEAFGGKPVYRKGVITDNHGLIIDIHGLKILDPEQMETDLNQIPGVITNGLFAQRSADILLLGRPQGVETIKV